MHTLVAPSRVHHRAQRSGARTRARARARRDIIHAMFIRVQPSSAPRQQFPAQVELRPPRQIQSIPIHLCFSVSIRGSKIASPRHDGRITDVKRVQTPIRCGQSVFTPVLKAARSHMPSRCDSETPFCRITSDWHPRLSHAVASRLYNSHIALRLNCEAMPCNGLGRQFEEVIRRIGRSCKATAGAANQRSQQFGSPFRAWGDGNSGRVESCRPVGA